MRRGSRGVPGTMMKKVVAESRGESRTLMEEGGGYLEVYLLLQFVILLTSIQKWTKLEKSV